jgi:hypothetical protein
MTTSWRDDARERIAAVLLEHEAQALLMGEAMDKSALTKSIAAAYPYGPKTNHPYTQWLKERKLALMFFDLMAAGQFGYSARHFAEWSRSKLGKPDHQIKVQVAAATGQLSLLR